MEECVSAQTHANAQHATEDPNANIGDSLALFVNPNARMEDFAWETMIAGVDEVTRELTVRLNQR